jgi:hypothetical protein
VASYDLSVLVPKPSDTGKVLLQWHQLFWLSKFAQSKLFELNKNCVRFIQPLVKNKEGKDVIVVGETAPMLPGNSEPSKYGDYLVTGAVSQSADGYLMHLELQTTCSRKKVAAADVPFKPSADPDYIEQIGNQAASQLSPLIDKINAFAKKEREENNKVAYSNWGTESITIKPKKKHLAAGEETEIDITMKDCDGYVLANRRIDFLKGSINGMPINGTTGGTVTPSVVTTDANGKAKAKFKMGRGKTAMIAAHYLFYRPTGCLDAMIGSCPINGVPVKVVVEYDIDNEITFNPKIDLGGVKMEGGDEHSYFTRMYRASFYHYPSNTPDHMLLAIVPQEKVGMNTVFESEEGFFFYMKDKKQTNARAFLGNYQVLEEVMDSSESETNYGRVKAQHTTTFTFFKKNGMDPMSFGIYFNFENEGEENEIGTGGFPDGVSVNENDNGARITTKKITDPDSPYKTEYLVELDRKVVDVEAADKLLGTNFKGLYDAMNYKNEGTEHLRIRMLTPF